MRRYAVVAGECPPLSKYCMSREAVFVCSGHFLVSDSTDGNGDRFLTGYNDSMIGYEKIQV